MVRPFDWRDIPALYRYRKHGLWLDSNLELTRWLSLVPMGALLATIAPATGIFTYVTKGNGYPNLPIIGQVRHPSGSQFAHLTFIAPAAAIKSNGVPDLLDHLAAQVGKRGAHNLLGEVDVKAHSFEILRQAGYAIYTRQRIWRLENIVSRQDGPTNWLPAAAGDEIDVRSLYSALVPPMVQQAEPPPWEHLSGYVYREGPNLLAYIYLNYGPRGIWVQPFIHPDAERVTGRLAALIKDLPNRRGRPIYLAIRSYQAWLETSLIELGAKAGPRQAVMVKRLVVRQKALRPITIPRAGLKNAQPGASMTLLPPGKELENEHE